MNVSEPIVRALCILVPSGKLYEDVQRIRTKYDVKSDMHRWPPHIKLFHPLPENVDLDAIQAAVAKMPCFSVTLNRFCSSHIGKHYSMWLKPETDGKEIEEMHARILSSTPTLTATRPFESQLTVAQFPNASADDVARAQHQLQSEWRTASFDVTLIALFSRQGAQDPFHVERVFPLQKPLPFVPLPFSFAPESVLSIPNVVDTGSVASNVLASSNVLAASNVPAASAASAYSVASVSLPIRSIWKTTDGRIITVDKLDSFHEIQIENAPDSEDKKDASKALEQKHLHVLMRDTSGSMWDSYNPPNTIDVLNAELQKVVDKALAAGHEVALVSWAADSAWTWIDASNRTTALRESCEHNRKIKTSPQDFKESEWWGSTLPRLAFDRLQEILTYCAQQQKQLPSGVTLWFGTDGQFTPAPSHQPEKQLSEDYLKKLELFLVQYNVAMSMVYVGIVGDKTTDASRIMQLFPNSCEYLYAKTKQDLPRLKMDEKMMGGHVLYDRILTEQDGKKQVLTVESYARVQCSTLGFPNAQPQSSQLITDARTQEQLSMRADIYRVSAQLQALEAKRQKGEKVLAELMQLDTQLKKIDALITGQSKNRSGTSHARQVTREYLWSTVRVKNMLQQFAAVEVSHSVQGSRDGGRELLAQGQELKMAHGKKFDIAIAKRITQNSAGKRPWDSTITATVVQEEKEGKKLVNYRTTVTFVDDKDNKNNRHYDTNNVPIAVAEDDGIDILTVSSWKEVYESGSCKAQCVLFKRKPSEVVFHSPSRAYLHTSVTQVSFDTILDTIASRVNVSKDGVDYLFDHPFKGISAVDEYTAGLPIWSPNLNFVARYRLRSLVGYLLGGHDLAYPGRWFDLYIPAILSAWSQFFETGSEKMLEIAMLMQLAFVRTKEWMKLGNTLDSKAVSPADTLRLWSNNNQGSHAFLNVFEPLLYAMMEPNVVPVKELQQKLTAEIIYASAKYKDKDEKDQTQVTLNENEDDDEEQEVNVAAPVAEAMSGSVSKAVSALASVPASAPTTSGSLWSSYLKPIAREVSTLR